MRDIKFRAWDGKNMIEFLPCDVDGKQNLFALSRFFGFCDKSKEDVSLMQYTGLKDKNGVDIYEGDLVNIFLTSSNGEHIHDCIYQARIGRLGDLIFEFEKLLWESSGYNQYPLSRTLCQRYRSLDFDLCGGSIKVPESYGGNNILGTRWKQNDESYYFEVIGNIHENPELLD